MDVLKAIHVSSGEIKCRIIFLASKILDMFEEVEGTLNAHGTGASRVDVPISTL
jgi:hypothetical protein